MKRALPQQQGGVSLIEALVALAVMAFGILGIVGMQGSLRSNADMSKQRSQAVRVAQEALENWRSYTVVKHPNPADTQFAFEDIVTDSAATTVSGYSGLSTSFEFLRSQTDATLGRYKTVTVDVSWKDRNDQLQSVSLTSNISGVPPELGGSVGIPGDQAPQRKPLGRNSAIPVGAVDQGNGTSTFAPPGAATGVSWTFSNTSGVITTICNPSCSSGTWFLLSGYVRFVLNVAPTPAQGENPIDLPPSTTSIGVDVLLTAPSTPPVVNCYTAPILTGPGLKYACAVPTELTDTNSTASDTSDDLPAWSGASQLVFSPNLIAPFLSDATASLFKVCRYTPTDTDTPASGNVAHPLPYTVVLGPLVNQNFLVISAGDGSIAFNCPDDDTSSTSPLNTNTYRHQPVI